MIRHKSLFFYGWLIALACMLLHFCTAGMTCLGFSLHAAALRESLGFSHRQIAAVHTIRSLFSLISLPFVERFYRRVSLRSGLSLTCLTLGLAYLGFACSKSPWQFDLLALVMGFAYSFGGAVPITILLHSWLTTRRGTASSTALCGAGLFSMAAPLLVELLIERIGLQNTFLVEGGCVIGVSLLLLLVLRNTPAEINLTPYDKGGGNGGSMEKPAVWEGTVRRALGLIMAASFFLGCVGAPGSTTISIHLNLTGHSGTLAAAAVSVFGILLTAGKFAYGFLTDRYGAVRVNLPFFACWTAGLFLIAFPENFLPAQLLFAMAIYGFGNSLTTVGIPVWIENHSTEDKFETNRTIRIFAKGYDKSGPR